MSTQEISIVCDCSVCYRTIWTNTKCLHGIAPKVKKKKPTDLEIIEKNLQEIPPSDKIKKGGGKTKR